MVNWINLDKVEAYKELEAATKINLKEVMTGANGAERVKKYSVPMAEGMAYNFAAKQVDDNILEILGKLAEETQLVEKFAALYNGEMINTGEKRLVLHHMCRGHPTLQGPCGRSQKWRGSLRFLPPIEMRPSFISSNLVESREAPLTPQYPSPLRGTWEVH